VPALPAPGVPLNTPVAAMKPTPVGRIPLSMRVGAGEPVAITVKLRADPNVNVTAFELMIAGAWFAGGSEGAWVVPAHPAMSPTTERAAIEMNFAGHLRNAPACRQTGSGE
jgi:hypothetical protein